MTYRIVSSLESGGEGETITDKSPVGQALLGHRVGEVVDVEAPAGVVQLQDPRDRPLSAGIVRTEQEMRAARPHFLCRVRRRRRKNAFSSGQTPETW